MNDRRLEEKNTHPECVSYTGKNVNYVPIILSLSIIITATQTHTHLGVNLALVEVCEERCYWITLF